ncbi:MAG: glycosyltransferase family 2 protein [Erysipelotrichaceae bacterium]|nr:glycosyltransferase family 2 protein [Erysipelotrichaceae bacterium]
MSKVSIIVPVYNREKVIRRCVHSILNQDYRDIEVILVDDGSRDSSFKIISEFAQNDERVIAIHKENGGVSSTRNKALSVASGDYVQFLDADDWLPFDSTKLLVREMEENDVEMVVGDFYRVVGNKVSKKGSIHEAAVITRNEYADKMMLTPADFYYGVLWNKLYKREIIEKHHIFMDTNISYCEDVIFNLEYLLHVRNVAVLKAPVYYYVKTEGSLVRQNLSIEKTVRMKTSVIKYYNEFYRNILDSDDYEERKPIIYGYLVAVSTDAFAIPFFSDTHKLGQEDGVPVYYESELDDAGFMLRYLGANLFDRLLSTVALANKLDLNDVKVLYVLYKSGRGYNLNELASITGLSVTACTIALTKLIALGHIRITDVDLFGEHKLSYEYKNGKMDEQLAKIIDDYTSVSFMGISDQDREQYLETRKKIQDNFKRTMVSEEE